MHRITLSIEALFLLPLALLHCLAQRLGRPAPAAPPAPAPAAAPAAAAAPPVLALVPTPLERHTVPQLRTLARQAGMKQLARTGRRADLLAALAHHRETA